MIVNFLKNSNINYNIDYLSSLANLLIFIPMIFFSNTIYTFLFILELISLTILYKFSVSKVLFFKKTSNKQIFSRTLPKHFLNMMFFQY